MVEYVKSIWGTKIITNKREIEISSVDIKTMEVYLSDSPIKRSKIIIYLTRDSVDSYKYWGKENILGLYIGHASMHGTTCEVVMLVLQDDISAAASEHILKFGYEDIISDRMHRPFANVLRRNMTILSYDAVYEAYFRFKEKNYMLNGEEKAYLAQVFEKFESEHKADIGKYALMRGKILEEIREASNKR